MLLAFAHTNADANHSTSEHSLPRRGRDVAPAAGSRH